MKQDKSNTSARRPNGRRENSDLTGMFVHHVLFWLKEPENKVHLEKFKKELHQLLSIETIRFSHIGVPAATNRKVIDSSYQYSLLVIFDDRKGHDIYQDHDKHHKFIAECGDLWETVLVYDSWH